MLQPPFLQHVNDLKTGHKRQADKTATEDHSVESYKAQNKWLNWAELKAVVEAQIPIANAVIDGIVNNDPVDSKDLHFVTMTCAILADIDCTAKRGGEDPQLVAEDVAAALQQEPSIIQTGKFKTAGKYGLKAYVLTDRARALWTRYQNVVRPVLLARRVKNSPKCGFFFLSTTGVQLTNYEHDTTKFFKLITGDASLHLNHTQMRKIESTAAAEQATAEEADTMRVVRAHSDATSKAWYVKKAAIDSAKKAAVTRSKVLGTPLAAGLKTASDKPVESKQATVVTLAAVDSDSESQSESPSAFDDDDIEEDDASAYEKVPEGGGSSSSEYEEESGEDR